MYIPPHFAETSVPDLHSYMTANPLAVIVTAGIAGLEATHVPLVLDAIAGPYGTLRGHLAKANPQSAVFASGGEALVIFSGPDAYISPRWYGPGAAAPTWNYVAVHAYGVPRIVSDPAAVRELLAAQVARFEAGTLQPWTMEQLEREYVAARIGEIVAFELPIARLEGKAKMSQNRPADAEGIVRGLSERGDPERLAVADEVGRRAGR